MNHDPYMNEQGFPLDLEYGKFLFVKKLYSDGKGLVCQYKSQPQKTG